MNLDILIDFLKLFYIPLMLLIMPIVAVFFLSQLIRMVINGDSYMSSRSSVRENDYSSKVNLDKSNYSNTGDKKSRNSSDYSNSSSKKSRSSNSSNSDSLIATSLAASSYSSYDDGCSSSSYDSGSSSSHDSGSSCGFGD